MNTTPAYNAVLSDGHPDRGGHHRVVDAIAHVKCLHFSRLLADDVQLFFVAAER